MTAFSLRARWVLPVDGPPLEHGVVAVEGGVIRLVGTRSDGGTIIDLGDAVLLPGLVNAHTHLEFSTLRKPLGAAGLPLPEWIRLVIAARGGRSDSAEAIATGLRESLGWGVTSVGDIATGNGAAAVGECELSVLAFQEVIGFSRARADSVFGELMERIEGAAPAAALGISPHAPYTVGWKLLERLVELAHTRALPLAMHLAESREELEMLETGGGPFRELLQERSMWDDGAIPPGTTWLDYLQRLCRAPRALVVHGNYLRTAEHELLAAERERLAVVYCPRTHAFFGHDPYPLGTMLAAGVRVALGTDSRASTPDLDLWQEVRTAARLHPGVAPERLIALATLDAARALGWDATLGSLTPGKRADLVALPIAAGTGWETSLHEAPPQRRVWLGGREFNTAV